MADLDITQLCNVYERLLQAIQEEKGLQRFALQFERLSQTIRDNCVPEPQQMRTVVAISCVRQLALCLLQILSVHRQVGVWASEEVSRLLEQHPPAPIQPSVESATTDSLNSGIMRQWFADNIVDPKPDKNAKVDIVRRTNALPGGGVGGRSRMPLHYNQVMLWFINMRRRSGWTAFRNIYAQGNVDKLEMITSTLRRQPQAPPTGIKDDVAALMVSWNIPLESEIAASGVRYDKDDDDMDEDDDDASNKGKRRASGSRSAKKDKATKTKATATATAPAPKSKSASVGDPKGTVRAQECREAYEKMMSYITVGAKERVGDWLAEVLAEADSKPRKKNKGRVSAESSTSNTEERKIAALPTRASERQKSKKEPLLDQLPPKKTSASASGSSAQVSTYAKPYLFSAESGPRLPTSLPSFYPSQANGLPASFWQSSSTAAEASTSAESSMLSSPPRLNLHFSMPSTSLFPGGTPAVPRNASGTSIFSSSGTSTAESSLSSSQASILSLPSVGSSSSQASYALFASGVGASDDSLVRSNCSSASSVDETEAEAGESSSLATSVSRQLVLQPHVALSSFVPTQRAATDDQVLLEPVTKRARQVNRPRHTDGGAPSGLVGTSSSLATSSSQTDSQQQQASQTVPPFLSLNFNLSVSMNPSGQSTVSTGPSQNFTSGSGDQMLTGPPVQAAADLATWYYNVFAAQQQQQQSAAAMNGRVVSQPLTQTPVLLPGPGQWNFDRRVVSGPGRFGGFMGQDSQGGM